jgi:hypothetical protein
MTKQIANIDDQVIRLIVDYVSLIKGASRLRDQEAKDFANKLIENKENQLNDVGVTWEQIDLLRKVVRL